MSLQSRKAVSTRVPANSTSGSGCLGLIVLPFKLLGDIANSLIKPETRRSTLILIGSVLASCFVCFGAASAIGGGGTVNTPAPTIDINAINTQAVLSAWSKYTQTAEALPTSTLTSTVTAVPTNTSGPTNTASPTWTARPTETNTAIPTATFLYIAPTIAPPSGGSGGSGFDSNSDGKVTCKDFNYQFEAQEAYRAGQTQLDGNDNDGLACESLP